MTDVKITPEAKARLAELENEHGELTPSVVVDDAKQKESPLHGLFDWNLKSAAHKHWLHQARVIIHSVKVMVTTEHVTIQAPCYVRNPSVGAKEQGYVSLTELRKNKTHARESLRLEFGRAESALRRARVIATALRLEQDVEALIAELVTLTNRLTTKKAKPQKRRAA